MSASTIKIGNKEYPLLLTTRATKNIAARYGGLENLGEKLLKSESFEMAIDEIIWLIVELANQHIKVSILKGEPEVPLLTADKVELLTTPFDLAKFKDAIMEALSEGMSRNIHSEETKNKAAE